MVPKPTYLRKVVVRVELAEQLQVNFLPLHLLDIAAKAVRSKDAPKVHFFAMICGFVALVIIQNFRTPGRKSEKEKIDER